jgi:cell division protein FtsL
MEKDRKERRAPRSQRYQFLLLESVFPTEMLEAFSNEESVYKRLNPFDYNEEIMQLEEELKKEFWRVVNSCLTERQRQVIELSSQGKTQMEIAKELNVNQSSITKSLHGNVDYNKGSRVYGGSLKRMKKLCENDPKIKIILDRISELRGENWL